MGKKKTTTSTRQTQVQTPNAPSYVKDNIEILSGQIKDLAGRDATDFHTGASPLQNQAFDLASELGKKDFAIRPPGFEGGAAFSGAQSVEPPRQLSIPSGKSFRQNGANTAEMGSFDPAAAMSGAVVNEDKYQPVQAQSLLTDLGKYMNPYTEDVVNASLADFDANAGQTRAAQMAAAGRNSALGGSQFAVQQGITEGELARARAATSSGLRSDAFNVGAALSNQDADRRQQANAQNSSNSLSIALQNAAYDQDAQTRNMAATNDLNQLLGQLETSNNQFNAGQHDIAADRFLAENSRQRANQRADIQLLSELGTTQRDIENSKNNAELQLLQILSGINAQQPYDLVTGQTINSNGTSTTKGPGLLGTLGQSFAGSLGGGAGAVIFS